VLTPHRVRLTDADREEYGGPEWIEITPTKFLDVRVSTLRNWEEQTGLKVLDVLSRDFDARREIVAYTAVVWMARQIAGCTEKYDDFDPHLLSATLEKLPPAGADDADPPSSSSAATSAEEARTKASRPKRGSGR
jgi:hypothetical protein